MWPIARGFYMGPKVSNAALREWSEAFRKAAASPDFPALQAKHGLYPLALTDEPLKQFIDKRMAEYRALTSELDLPRR